VEVDNSKLLLERADLRISSSMRGVGDFDRFSETADNFASGFLTLGVIAASVKSVCSGPAIFEGDSFFSSN